MVRGHTSLAKCHQRGAVLVSAGSRVTPVLSQATFPESAGGFGRLSGVASGRNALPSGQVLARSGFIATLVLPVQVLNPTWGLGGRDPPHAPCCLWPGNNRKPPFSGTGRHVSPLWHHVASLPARTLQYRLSGSCIEHLLYAGTMQHRCSLPRGLGIHFLPKVSHPTNSDRCISRLHNLSEPSRQEIWCSFPLSLPSRPLYVSRNTHFFHCSFEKRNVKRISKWGLK